MGAWRQDTSGQVGTIPIFFSVYHLSAHFLVSYPNFLQEISSSPSQSTYSRWRCTGAGYPGLNQSADLSRTMKALRLYSTYEKSRKPATILWMLTENIRLFDKNTDINVLSLAEAVTRVSAYFHWSHKFQFHRATKRAT